MLPIFFSFHSYFLTKRFLNSKKSTRFVQKIFTFEYHTFYKTNFCRQNVPSVLEI